MDDVLEGGPWMIHNIPIILKPMTMYTSLLKEDLTHVPVWVKLHDVPLAAFLKDGLNLIVTTLGRGSCYFVVGGRSSFAHALIEVRTKDELKDSLIIVIPLLDGLGLSKEMIQVEYE